VLAGPQQDVVGGVAVDQAERRLDSVHSADLLSRLQLQDARGWTGLPAPAVSADPAQYDLAPAAQYDLAPAARAELGGDLRALALIDLGIAEAWTARFDEADRHLDDGIALARRIGRPYLEVTAWRTWPSC